MLKKTKRIYSAITLTLTFPLFSCGQSAYKQTGQIPKLDEMAKAGQINISELKSVLIRSQNQKLAFDFFGIHSNGIDCIYFIPDSSLFNIDFEAMHEEQFVWMDKLRQFAEQNGFRTQITSYGNKPHYKTSDTAPVLQIETKSDIDQTTAIGYKIMTEVFENSDQTIYEIVP